MSTRKQNGPRRRTGCGVCKNSHVKCTEEKPACRRCVRLRLDCGYEFKLLWEEDALQRKIVHGRAGVWSRAGKSIPPIPGSQHYPTGNFIAVTTGHLPFGWKFVNFSLHDFAHGNALRRLERDEIYEDRNVGENEEYAVQVSSLTEKAQELLGAIQSPEEADEEIERNDSWDLAYTEVAYDTLETYSIPLPSLYYMPGTALEDMDAQLFSYYIHELSPKCSISLDLNPYLNVLLPIAYNFEPLRHSLLAASACQLRLTNGDRQYEVHSLRHRSKAMRGLRRHLDREQMDWKSLATMVMFCFRDITDGCEPSWITHLKMGMRVLKDLRCTTETDADLKNFCEMYFVGHEVMGRTAWDNEMATEHYQWEKDEYYEEIDPIMGCSRELISLISQISFLAAQCAVEIDRGEPEGLAIMADSLMLELSRVQQIPRTGAENVGSMVQIAEVKRLSAMLYLHDRVTTRWTDSPGNPFGKQLQDSIIAVLHNLPVTSGASLWPLFVLGNSPLEGTEQVEFVLDRLHQLESSRNLGSVHHARRRVERSIMARISGDLSTVSPHRHLHDIALNDNERWVSLA